MLFRSIPTGTGLALAAKLNKKDQISIIPIGDGAIEEGAFYESLNFSVVKEIPALFFCENNLYSVYSPLDVRQPNERSLCKLASAIGAYTIKSDGNCVLSCYENLEKAITYCRRERKPVFIEFSTYRWLEHCGPNIDNNLGYREKSEHNKWLKKDSLKLIKLRLSLLDRDLPFKIENLINKEIQRAFNYAKNSKFPASHMAYKGVYATK